MGIVYKATQHTLKRSVAVKVVLAGGHAGPQELARFRLEAEALAQLQHPNIVQVYEVGEHDGIPFFVMELVDGSKLDCKIPVTAQRAARLVEILARAVHYAHGRGIVHRDLKPGNILLTAEGMPKVSDFGLAKHLGREGALTQSGAVMGTPLYMAPEQAMGKSREIGPASDVYSLGAILYEMLTGRPPFWGETAQQIMEQVQSAEPVPPSRLQPHVASALETVCLKCLEKDPCGRYPTAAALADDLARFLDNQPVRARRKSVWQRSMQWARARPKRTAGMAIGALGALCFAFVILDQRHPPGHPVDPGTALLRVKEADAELTTAKAELRQTQRHVRDQPAMVREQTTALQTLRQRVSLAWQSLNAGIQRVQEASEIESKNPGVVLSALRQALALERSVQAKEEEVDKVLQEDPALPLKHAQAKVAAARLRLANCQIEAGLPPTLERGESLLDLKIVEAETNLKAHEAELAQALNPAFRRARDKRQRRAVAAAQRLLKKAKLMQELTEALVEYGKKAEFADSKELVLELTSLLETENRKLQALRGQDSRQSLSLFTARIEQAKARLRRLRHARTQEKN